MKVLGEKGQELSNTQSDLKEAQVALLSQCGSQPQNSTLMPQRVNI